MSLPDYQSFMTPLLECLANGKTVKLRDIDADVYHKIGLSTEQLKLRIPNGKQTYAYHRLGWAKTYLVQAGLIEQPKRAFCNITQKGLSALATGELINNQYLSQYPEFLDFKTRTKDTSDSLDENTTSLVNSNSHKTPEELIEAAVDTLNTNLSDEILQAVLSASPAFFENLVVDLMLAMGYGGSRKDAGQATQYTQDGGIDGVIKEDKLGLEMIYLQAKRYTNKTVGRPDIQAFAGALDMHRAKKGVFITTSGFSKDALEYVGLIEKRIVLVDGKQLTEQMLTHNLGVSTKQVFEVKALDSDYFIED
ncbi:restriction endonuclease [Pseudoalteromonas sp. NEC-BIFX-2020_015]|uniref:restriction endonuclease n=1 Tax=Pseudoalteromonas sp. NEC-BIFX-2020_015 TaxID=2729544 RepID=UPI0014616AB5|nr:restriction endonuclease [Pseudoalteromonas sp. NEC-BIFX-2020_015]NMR26404.1 restriction endonuclease [Pseudoalteromonas sp. NEC-BIFX-2020_015]